MRNENDNPEPDSSSNHYESLTVRAPDGCLFELNDVPPETTAREVAQAILEYAHSSTPERSESRRWAVDLIRDDGIKRLDPSETLRDAGVSDGDQIAISGEVRAAGGSVWVEVAEFIATAVASGVTGNAAYDLLKSTVRSIAVRWRKRRTDPQVSTLHESEAISIAHACACLQLHIADPRQLIAVSAQHNLSVSDNYDEWVITFRSSVLELARDVSVLVKSSGPEPEGIEVIVTADLRLDFSHEFPYLR